ncbi:MAG TPA: molybdopterin-binding/glycosyltransferase family 2 protein [Stellaceae bacterium]|nr:molybdopterin-binding/glycosyltransferase family 2 protein [Stellaceae bacterium]
MKFGDTPLNEAVGAVLAHSLKVPGRAIKKGRVLTEADIAALAAGGMTSVVAARLEPGDIAEDAAADAVAGALAGAHVTSGRAFTGRANFYADTAGLCVVDRAAVERLNLIDETITLATLEPDSIVKPKEMVATVKIIPFAVRGEAVRACAAVAARPIFFVAPFHAQKVALIQTRLPGIKESILDKTVDATRARLAALESDLVDERRCAHRVDALEPELRRALDEGVDMVLVAGASAILDRRDVIPASVVAVGGTIDHFGMPVDPGNLLLMARVGSVPVLGLPGCARSPRVNGFDWVLRRLVADLPVDEAVLARMGVGGLLSEIASRPLPRARAIAPQAETTEPDTPRAPRIGALVMAAGRSSRMGTVNKLLININGKPMVRHAVEAVRDAGLAPIVVVTGHQREQVTAALDDLPVRFAHNPDYAEGLSTSLKAGLGALPGDLDGVLVGLGDMPQVGASDIERLVAAFNPVEGRAIIVPTRNGKRGNPILWAKRFIPEMRQVEGDVGARSLIAAYPELVSEIEMASDGVLTDIDTPQALARLASSSRIEVTPAE